ncbi:MAG: signal peptidase II [Candidatus Buchananbacteria bacterium]|nr:signal peptidase II [Candidatus Buchananbacteria bacterium]
MFKKLFPWLVVALILFLVDRWLKYWFIKNPSEIIGEGFFDGVSFSLAKNAGIAFGFGFNRVALIVITIILILIMFRLLIKSFLEQELTQVVSFILIIVGAFSNLFDRMRFGFVVDYIDVAWFTVFNLADAAITIGVAVLVIVSFLHAKAGQN